jgi:hypothetical protein
MIRSMNTPAACAGPAAAIRVCTRRLKLRDLAQPRLISNLLALVALLSIGFV